MLFFRVRGSYSDIDGMLLKEQSELFPISALQANASDITLLFLSVNGVAFVTPCDDPWYAAHTLPIGGNTSRASLVGGDKPVSVLGCTEQYQFCNPDPKMGRSCTPLSGIHAATATADTLWRTDKQRGFFNTSSNSILNGAGGLYEIVAYTGISSLIARHSLSQGLQGSLPSNQWQLEVENWYGATLADLQRVAVEYATGPTDSAVFRFSKRPQTEEEHLVYQSLVSYLFKLPLFLISKHVFLN